MKKSVFICFLLVMTASLKAQQAGHIDTIELKRFHYERVLEINPQDSTQLLITLTFDNRSKQTAITYRQEYENSNVIWLETGKAVLKKNNIVESFVDNLAPGELTTYQYSFSNVKTEKNKIALEKAALLIMNDEFEVEKIIFEPEIVEFKDSKLQEHKGLSPQESDDSKIQELEE